MIGSTSNSPSPSTDSSGSAGAALSSRSTTPDCASIDTVFTLCQDTSAVIKSMDYRLRSVEDKTQQLSSTLKELNDYMKKYCRKSFVVKGSKYEVSCAVVVVSLIYL